MLKLILLFLLSLSFISCERQFEWHLSQYDGYSCVEIQQTICIRYNSSDIFNIITCSNTDREFIKIIFENGRDNYVYDTGCIVNYYQDSNCTKFIKKEKMIYKVQKYKDHNNVSHEMFTRSCKDYPLGGFEYCITVKVSDHEDPKGFFIFLGIVIVTALLTTGIVCFCVREHAGYESI